MISKDQLQYLYYDEDMSLRQIGNYFDVDHKTVLSRMKEYRLPRRGRGHCSTNIKLNEEQYEIFQGCMLGDGCLPIKKNYITPMYSHTDKHEEFLIWLADQLGIFSISTIYPVYHSRSSDFPYEFQLHTKCISSLRDESHRWYPSGRGHKVVPSDLNLTRLSLRHWYLGDGSLLRARYPILTTLLPYNIALDFVMQLKKLLNVTDGISLTEDKRFNRFMIRILRRHTPKFLDFIYQDDIPECYQYKWGAICRKKVQLKEPNLRKG